jgi:hypothetical protein
MGINGLYVMKQAGFCVEGHGELGLISSFPAMGSYITPLSATSFSFCGITF